MTGTDRSVSSTARVLRWGALLLLVGAYLQGGINKAIDFPSALVKMQHFGLTPAAPLAVATIALELGASAMVLTGWMRWLGALLLACFTLAATFIANKFGPHQCLIASCLRTRFSSIWGW